MDLTRKFGRQYNIYCDESSVDNKNLQYFTIGSIFIPRDQKKRITEKVELLKKKYNFRREIKWNKVTSMHKNLYKELINLFAEENDMQFKVIVIDKKNINMSYHNNDNELMFYKFYYQLLKEKLNNDCQYYIYVDEKSRSFKPRFRELEDYLEKLYLKRNLNIDIKHMQEYRSNEIILLQLADFFTGLVAYANCFNSGNGVREDLRKQVEELFEVSLTLGTNRHFDKFNIFKWIPNNTNDRN